MDYQKKLEGMICEAVRNVRGNLCVRVGSGTGGGFCNCTVGVKEFMENAIKPPVDLMALGMPKGFCSTVKRARSATGMESIVKIVRKDKDHVLRNALAIQTMAEEAGMGDLVPKIAVGPVKVDAAVAKRFGGKDNVQGMFMERAPGVSLKMALTESRLTGKNRLKDVKGKQVVNAAIFDVLFTQQDRNIGGVMVDDHGNISLIDNDFVLGDTGDKALVGHKDLPSNSVFLPGTSFGDDAHGTMANVLDYRKHAENGMIGKKFSAKLERFLSKIRSSGVDDVAGLYGIDPYQAMILMRNASNLLEYGFEETLALQARHKDKASQRPVPYYQAGIQ